MNLSEDDLEREVLAWLSGIGYAVADGRDIGPEGSRSERVSYGDVVLTQRLRDALARLNPAASPDLHEEAFRRLTRSETPDLTAENRRLHKLLTEGVTIDVQRPDGGATGQTLRVIDFDRPEANDWLAVRQFTVIENGSEHRPDVVLFLNGLPVVVFELKRPVQAKDMLQDAWRQLQTYKMRIPSLFRYNAALVISDGQLARIGSLTADRERFMPWRTIDGEAVVKRAEAEVLTKGAFHQTFFLELLRDFMVFGTSGGSLIKILAGYHQFHAVRRAVACTITATRPDGDRRAGVIWHTQGSGKSLLMAFYAGQIIRHPAMETPTLVILTDRNDLDDQLFDTFGMCRDLLRQDPIQATDRAHLQELLNREAGGVIFTTIQKFSPDEGADYPALTQRRNVVVIADEAHRSQYGFRAKVKTGKDEYAVKYGFAKYLRDALPCASFIGFTGTPIEATDVNTPAVFGDYIDRYDISRAVEDKATVPIYYESRLALLNLPEDRKAAVDAEIEELTEGEEATAQEQLKREWARVEAIVGTQTRLERIARDLVEHFERRTGELTGKGMIVCMSRRICVLLYDELIKLRPEWHSEADDAGALKVVMTGAASDPPEWQGHIGSRAKARRDLIARRAKDPDDPLKLVIVRDMWLTGFDAPCMHTMYIDKPMKGHGLMQAIARVNRVFRDKPAGLVVDYIGVAQNLKAALSQYSPSDRERTGIDAAEAVALLQEKYEIVRRMYHGFDYSRVFAADASTGEKLNILAGAMDRILEAPHPLNGDHEKQTKDARLRYGNAMQELTQAFALASASDYARSIRDEVGFFQAVRTALDKEIRTTGQAKSQGEYSTAVQQIISRAVVSTDIIDILAAAGIGSPNIGIMSDDFLEEVRQMTHKNLAVEALRKLLNGEIRAQGERNVTQAKAFSERLAEAIARYHNNAITTVGILEELIGLAKDMRAARKRGEDIGLSDEEVAFYDALADNESAREAMGHAELMVIAQELFNSLKRSITVDWMHREQARAQLRVLVKRILKKYGYPPDLQEAAVQNVLQQAEVLAGVLAKG